MQRSCEPEPFATPKSRHPFTRACAGDNGVQIARLEFQGRIDREVITEHGRGEIGQHGIAWLLAKLFGHGKGSPEPISLLDYFPNQSHLKGPGGRDALARDNQWKRMSPAEQAR